MCCLKSVHFFLPIFMEQNFYPVSDIQSHRAAEVGGPLGDWCNSIWRPDHENN